MCNFFNLSNKQIVLFINFSKLVTIESFKNRINLSLLFFYLKIRNLNSLLFKLGFDFEEFFFLLCCFLLDLLDLSEQVNDFIKDFGLSRTKRYGRWRLWGQLSLKLIENWQGLLFGVDRYLSGLHKFFDDGLGLWVFEFIKRDVFDVRVGVESGIKVIKREVTGLSHGFAFDLMMIFYGSTILTI